VKVEPAKRYREPSPAVAYDAMWQRCREDYPRVSRHEFDLACGAALLSLMGQDMISLADYWSRMEPLLQNLPSAGGSGERVEL
jgi:hypothetical protein